MDVQTLTDHEALSTLAVEWRALWERDPTASIFHTDEYASTAWETELGADRALAVVTMREAGLLVGLGAVTIDPDGGLRFLGNAEITDYLGPISAEADRGRFADAFIGAIAGLPGWSFAELLGLAADSGWPDALARAAKDAGFDVEHGRHDVCPRIALSGSFDDYLAGLPSKLRHEIRRKARRLEREIGGYAIRLSDDAGLDVDLETFYQMHRASQGPKGKFLHDDMVPVFSRLAHTFAARGWLRLAWLEAEGAPLAATLSFSERGVWSVYNSAYDHTKRDLGPGMVLMGDTIRLATEEGCSVVDLLRGDEPYKYRFGAEDVPLIKLNLARSARTSMT